MNFQDCRHELDLIKLYVSSRGVFALSPCCVCVCLLIKNIPFYEILYRGIVMETTNGKISDIEESLKKLSSSSKNVIGGFVMSLEGEMIKSTLDPATTSQVSDLLSSLVILAREKLAKLEQGNDLEMVRLRTNKYQFVVVPDVSWLLVMVLNP